MKADFLAVLSPAATPLMRSSGTPGCCGRTGPGRRPARLETLERNATSLTQIVEDVLDVSRMSRARFAGRGNGELP